MLWQDFSDFVFLGYGIRILHKVFLDKTGLYGGTVETQLSIGLNRTFLTDVNA